MTDVPSVNFDRAAGFYDATRPVDDAELTQTLDLLQRTLNLSGPTLEIGVGTGALALPLAERGWRMTGVDISAAMMAKLVEKVAELPARAGPSRRHRAPVRRRLLRRRLRPPRLPPDPPVA